MSRHGSSVLIGYTGARENLFGPAQPKPCQNERPAWAAVLAGHLSIGLELLLHTFGGLEQILGGMTFLVALDE